VAAVDGAVVPPAVDGTPTVDGAAAPAAVPSGSLPTAKIEKPPAAVVAAKPDAPKAEAPKADAKADKKGGPRVHVVAKGDTLYKLAARYYGDSSRWEDIQKANKATLKKGIDLTLGQEIKIP